MTAITAMDIKPSGDADADFVAMMVSHHQGTIDLAQAQLHHVTLPRLGPRAAEMGGFCAFFTRGISN